MPFTGPREDRDAIRELYATYGDASTCGDTERFLACFAEDGQWNTHIFQRTGKAELRAQWDQLWAGFERVGFLGEVGSIEVEGDAACCRCVAREIVLLKTGGVYKLIGQYTDRLVRQNGAWLFAQRDYRPIVEELPA
ncbi:nuclear transport factor 2 family protein [Novosphingobium album (ex Hu et al. 2023)]|uniref:Nuclear transport factor 2 family protein n=1 Tax=Novosphingobium album (ex Hu et al. 2023) TaxID=2930093 RepID=A0ABT0B724_9SPHN|nr:nuclear transport factor 2 family protein [Novosphingobium album (ex Hu et al. 2023)]MCJ2180865.1 nuclear transport factor 2 family protein [Novosphingobium album (ex Hu et al. 2023)]